MCLLRGRTRDRQELSIRRLLVCVRWVPMRFRGAGFRVVVVAGVAVCCAGVARAWQQAKPPTRDAHTAGYVQARELADGENAPAGTDGNFILGARAQGGGGGDGCSAGDAWAGG